VYDVGGNLEATFKNIRSIDLPGYLERGIRESINNNRSYKNKYFKFYDDDEPDETIEVPYICIIDEIPFNSYAEAGRYLGLSR
jgi:hypothetical protein